jgi:hypothetical protein
MADESRPTPVPPKAVPEHIDRILRESDKNEHKFDPVQRRRRDTEPTGRNLLGGYAISSSGPSRGEWHDHDDADEIESIDHPTRDSE